MPTTHDAKENIFSYSSCPSLSFSAEAVLEQMRKILADPIFHNSKRCCTFLEFVVVNTLKGHSENLKERIIGVELYGRSSDYVTSDDATVRVAASELRKRLLQYYSEPSHRDELRIEIPVRSYVAEFSLPAPPPEPAEQSTTASKRSLLRWSFSLPMLGLVLLAVLFYRSVVSAPAIDRFWAPMLHTKGPVSISIGGPPADQPEGKVPFSRNSTADARTTLHEFLSPQFVFPLTDLTAETAITSYLGTHGKECVMRFAPTTTLAELSGQPLVTIGSLRNDWSLHLGANLRFHIPITEPPTRNWIEDSFHPADRRWSVDMNAPYEQVSSDYALISRVHDQTTGQWWVGVAGLTGLATLAAQQLIVDPEAMTELARQLPRDWDQKNLQIVLAVKIVRGSPGKPSIAAVYFW